MTRRFRWLAALAFAFGGATTIAAACSLGEGITPNCTVDPADPNRCQDVAVCDQGNGLVDPTKSTPSGVPCCQATADKELQRCQGAGATLDVAGVCMMMGLDACVQRACDTHTVCLTGTLNGAGSGGGGAGGVAGGGGMAGAGGAGGSGGTGGGGMGGAGGN